MDKASKKKTKFSQLNWLPPKGASAYFLASSDDAFKKEHPIGYFFLVLLGIFAFMLPVVLYIAHASAIGGNSQWMTLGFAGAFIIGVGLFNFVSIIIKQYMGHLVSIISFILGGLLIAISLYLI